MDKQKAKGFYWVRAYSKTPWVVVEIADCGGEKMAIFCGIDKPVPLPVECIADFVGPLTPPSANWPES